MLDPELLDIYNTTKIIVFFFGMLGSPVTARGVSLFFFLAGLVRFGPVEFSLVLSCLVLFGPVFFLSWLASSRLVSFSFVSFRFVLSCLVSSSLAVQQCVLRITVVYCAFAVGHVETQCDRAYAESLKKF